MVGRMKNMPRRQQKAAGAAMRTKRHHNRATTTHKKTLHIGDSCNRGELSAARLTGYVRGEEFIGEWTDGTPMEGYGMYYVEDGYVHEFGDFSESGKLSDRVDAGDLIESHNETSFKIVKIE